MENVDIMVLDDMYIGTFQVTNYTLKSAASVSNALGSVVVSYSIFHALLSLAGGTLSLLIINFHSPDFLFIVIQITFTFPISYLLVSR